MRESSVTIAAAPVAPDAVVLPLFAAPVGVRGAPATGLLNWLGASGVDVAIEANLPENSFQNFSYTDRYISGGGRVVYDPLLRLTHHGSQPVS